MYTPLPTPVNPQLPLCYQAADVFYTPLASLVAQKVKNPSAMQEQMTSTVREPKLAVLAGCLKGLASLMCNFTKSMEEGIA